MNKLLAILLCSGLISISSAQQHTSLEVESWITQPDRSMLFQRQVEKIPFNAEPGRGGATIVIDESLQMQDVDGFGFALTGGSAELMMQMTPPRHVRPYYKIYFQLKVTRPELATYGLQSVHPT